MIENAISVINQVLQIAGNTDCPSYIPATNGMNRDFAEFNAKRSNLMTLATIKQRYEWSEQTRADLAGTYPYDLQICMEKTGGSLDWNSLLSLALQSGLDYVTVNLWESQNEYRRKIKFQAKEIEDLQREAQKITYM